MAGQSQTLVRGGFAALLVICASVMAPPVHAGRGTERALVSEPVIANLAPPLTLKTARECNRWQSAAARLGETYGGYRLRAIVDRYGCGYTEGNRAVQRVWNWPWHGEGLAPAVPPILHARFGAWDIRCEPIAGRNRCAMTSEAAVVAVAGSPAAGRIVSTHFVIDTVADRESMIWRILMPPARGLLKTRTAAAGNGFVSFSLGGPAVSQPFTTCRDNACLMEAPVTASANAATRLWDGHAIDIDIPAAEGASTNGPDHARISAAGFRAAFRELNRLRRAENRQSAN
jgi:invasion protein IalB